MPPSKSKLKVPSKSKHKAKSASSTAVTQHIRTPTTMPPSESKVKLRAPVKSTRMTRSKTKSTGSIAVTQRDGGLVWYPLTEFPQFAKLPVELQLMIWERANFARVVTLKPGPLSYPPLYHACHNSRMICSRAGYEFSIDHKDKSAGFVISPIQDTLLLDRTSFSDSATYHNNSFHTIECEDLEVSKLKKVERLVMDFEEVLAVWKYQCFHCFLMNKLPKFFPNLKELMILLRRGPIDFVHDDLYEYAITDSSPATFKHIRDEVQQVFKNAQDDKHIKDVQLKFMRNEKWTT